MKKILVIVAMMAVLSGCGKTETLTCTSEASYGTFTGKSTYMIDYQGNDVKMLTVTYSYKDNHVDGVGTGTDGTTDDTDTDDDGIIDGVVGEALDDVVTGIADGILDMAGIKERHNARFGNYTNTDGFKTMVDIDSDTDYRITYTYDLDKLSDTDIANFNISRDYETLRRTYTDRGITCR